MIRDGYVIRVGFPEDIYPPQNDYDDDLYDEEIAAVEEDDMDMR